MLVLHRRTDQVVTIGRDGAIRVRVLEARDGRVTLGIDAPPQVPVHRLEVYEAIRSGPPRRDGA